VPQTYRHFFAPRRTDEFVGEILYRRRGRTETDFDLYRDGGTLALFVVGNEAQRMGPAGSTTHTVYSVEEFLALAPRYRRRLVAALRAPPSPGRPSAPRGSPT
jgi:hypothetical protein